VDPTLAAARDLFDDAILQMRSSVEGASDETVNRRPAGDDTNSIAVLVTHSMLSTRMWLACSIGTASPERDRPTEFRTSAGADELLSFIDRTTEECRSILAAEERFEPGAEREEPPTSPEDLPTGERTTAAWALMHALEHLHEHAGQASLTRQVLDRSA
jgi:uncharacterized damage-inducible protein DinB